MGDLAGALSQKLNISGSPGKKFITKTVTQPRKANETDDDIAILSMIMPGETFYCCLRNDCRMGDPKESSLGNSNFS